MNVLNLVACLSRGEEHAITAKELSKLLNWSERDITSAVNILRKSGKIICSSAKGYFLPSCNEDVKELVRQMNGRIKDMKRATAPAEKFLKKYQERIL